VLIGIDEAGRGPVLGPMVLAVVVIAPEAEDEFKALGIKDSKKYGSGKKGHERRARARDLIMEKAACYAIEIVYPSVIDQWVHDRSLNALERHIAEKLLRGVDATQGDLIVADGEGLFGPLRAFWPSLSAEDKADTNHVSVAAASVLAKTERDARMAEISAKYEREGYPPLRGGGYVNEWSIRFMEDYAEKHGGELPPEARKSWKWQRTRAEALPGGDILDLFGSD